MKEKRSSFVRLWGYLKTYRYAVIFATLLKILSVVMSVVEPYILGLAITELTANLTDMMKGVPGAQINASYVGWVMIIYLFRGVLYRTRILFFQLLYDQGQSKVQSRICAMIYLKKSTASQFLTLISTNSETFSVVLQVMLRQYPMPCNSPSYRL